MPRGGGQVWMSLNFPRMLHKYKNNALSVSALGKIWMNDFYPIRQIILEKSLDTVNLAILEQLVEELVLKKRNRTNGKSSKKFKEKF